MWLNRNIISKSSWHAPCQHTRTYHIRSDGEEQKKKKTNPRTRDRRVFRFTVRTDNDIRDGPCRELTIPPQSITPNRTGNNEL